MVIDTSGNVGIGTTTPNALLNVAGVNPRFRIDNTSGTASVFRIGADSGNAWLGTESNSPLYFMTNASERMRIDSSGNVGIGTTSPNAKLDVAGPLRIGHGTSAGYQFTEASDDTYLKLSYHTDATTLYKDNILVANFNGNVGIGTAAP